MDIVRRRYTKTENQAPVRSGFALHTYLEPTAAGVLMALSTRENPTKPAAHRVLERLIREELERLRPGAWDELLAAATEVPDGTPRERASFIAGRCVEVMRAMGGGR